jgi:hypothetical protein
MLASIVVGGASFKLFRSLLTGPLFPAGSFMAPIPYWTTRGLMNGAAVLGESTVFVAAHKAIDWGLGNEVHFSREEFLSTTGMLASLRLAGAFMGGVGRILVGQGVRIPYLPQVLGAAGMYGGIVGSQLIDQHLIQEGPAQGIDWFNAGVTLSHFIGAGYLLKHIHRMMPESFQKWEARMEERVAKALDRSRPWLGNLFPPSSPHAVTDTGFSAPISFGTGRDPKVETAFRINRDDEAEGPNTEGGGVYSMREVRRRALEQEEARWRRAGKDPNDILKRLSEEERVPPEIVKIIAAIHQAYGGRDALFLQTFHGLMQVRDNPDNAKILQEIPLRRLHHIVAHTDPHGARGGYSDWIARLALDSMIEVRKGNGIESLLSHLRTEQPLTKFEDFVSNILFIDGLQWLPLHPSSANSRDYEAIDALRGLERPEKTILKRWLRTQKGAGLQPMYHVEPEPFLNRLQTFIDAAPGQSRTMVVDALQLAERSPLAQLRLKRLDLVLQQRGAALRANLGELGDPGFLLLGEGLPSKFRLARGPGFTGPSIIIPSPNGDYLRYSQFDGYSGDARVAGAVHALYAGLTYYQAPRVARDAATTRDTRLQEAVLGKIGERKEFNNADIVAGLRALKDPAAAEAARDIANKEVELMPLKARAFDERYPAVKSSAQYSRPGVWGDKARITFRNPPQDYETEPLGTAALFESLMAVFHEHRHFLTLPHGAITWVDYFHSELNAYIPEFLLRAKQGAPRAMHVYTQWGNTGPALFLRNRHEDFYPEQRSGTGPYDSR